MAYTRLGRCRQRVEDDDSDAWKGNCDKEYWATASGGDVGVESAESRVEGRRTSRRDKRRRGRQVDGKDGWKGANEAEGQMLILGEVMDVQGSEEGRQA